LNLKNDADVAEALYDYAAMRYPGKEIIVMGAQLRLRNGSLFGKRPRLQSVDSALRVSDERGYV
jgi:hypothetical protein